MIVSSITYGMGDILTLTGIAKHFMDCEVHLQPQAERFSRFFRNICSKIVITENIQPMKEIGDDHYTLRKLRGLGYENLCYLPYIDINDEEKKIAKKLVQQFNNPIVFVANSAPQWKFDREPPQEYFQPIINELSKKYSILQFGLSNNFTPYKNTIPIMDLSIEELILYYYGIQKFIGIDTGDTHLMLAVGGECDVFIPRPKFRIPQAWNYNSSKIKYYYFN